MFLLGAAPVVTCRCGFCVSHEVDSHYCPGCNCYLYDPVVTCRCGFCVSHEVDSHYYPGCISYLYDPVVTCRCGFCVSHEVDSHYCPGCMENMPSAEARHKKNRYFLTIAYRRWALTWVYLLVGRLPMAQVGPLRECRGPGVVHTGVSSPAPFTVRWVPPCLLCVFYICS
jgi:hypothetical protein